MKRVFRAIYTSLGIYGAIYAFHRIAAGQLLLAGVDLLCSIGFFWMSFGEEEK
jgi:hypothetical protein